MKIQTALISVFNKEGLEPIVRLLDKEGVKIYSTGGTQKFIEDLGISVIAVETLTEYPSIFGGRVKTLHPKVFGGILSRRNHASDQEEAKEYAIPAIDLVIVDLYPFQETLASGASEEEIIEKIDIGGIALIRATAKNFKDTLIISSVKQYETFEQILLAQKGEVTLAQARLFAAQAFDVSSDYDTAIFNYFNGTLSQEEQIPTLKHSVQQNTVLRYGENPHQKGTFYGDLEAMFEQLNGKALSYNNLVDVDAAVALIDEFEDTKDENITFAILKHTNACGIAFGKTCLEAYQKAFAADTLSAFGGVLICNSTIDIAVAEELSKLFFEVLIAPDFDADALEVLKSKKKRVLLKRKPVALAKTISKTLLNGFIEQDKDLKTETADELRNVTNREATADEIKALLFASKICKHTKSNTIILANNGQLFASGVGQTSRVDALKQAIEKAKNFGFDLNNAVMASDAFFPFPDCVEIARQAGIKAVIQPGGSIKDKLSIDYCNQNEMAMVFTGIRHFKH